MEVIELDPARRLFKLDPLFDWTQDRPEVFVKEQAIPVSPASIGYAPCTRQIALGEQSGPSAGGGRRKTRKNAVSTRSVR